MRAALEVIQRVEMKMPAHPSSQVLTVDTNQQRIDAIRFHLGP